MYNNLPHPALYSHKSPNDAYADSSDFSNLCVFGSISYAPQPSKLLYKLEERSATGLAGYKFWDIQSKVTHEARTVMVFDGKFLSADEDPIHRLFP